MGVGADDGGVCVSSTVVAMTVETAETGSALDCAVPSMGRRVTDVVVRRRNISHSR